MLTTESVLLVALGFAIALVLAMIFGFSIWSAANSWASFRRRREVPATILDMQAEREALRAQNAMSTRRLQFQLDETRAQWAEKSAQLTRLRNRAIVMAKDLIAKDAEIASLRALAAELTNETNRRAKIIARLTGHEAVKLRSFDLPVPEGTKPAVIGEAKDGAGEAGAPIDRIKAKIAELNALSAQIASEQGDEGTAAASLLPPEPAARGPDTEPLALTALREDPVIEPVEEPPETVDLPPLAEAPPDDAPARTLTLAEKFKALREGING